MSIMLVCQNVMFDIYHPWMCDMSIVLMGQDGMVDLSLLKVLYEYYTGGSNWYDCFSVLSVLYEYYIGGSRWYGWFYPY